MEKTWQEVLEEEFKKEYFVELKKKVDVAYKEYTVYPEYKNIFKCFKMTQLKNVKVVILGQDPYHQPGQANGLCFSVNEGVALPPSLKNIYKEIEDDIGITMKNSGNLECWARQGVFLLNTILTVKDSSPLSFQNMGWEKFTLEMIKVLNEDDHPKVFLLWGSKAWEKEQYITNPNHLVLKSVHPSPLSAYRGFFGCKHFSKCNNYLKSKGLEPINWDNN
jgi:uracil-DNA glycosylase